MIKEKTLEPIAGGILLIEKEAGIERTDENGIFIVGLK
jgi:DUF1009 family protein